jgi:hypothetical protein
MEISPLTIAKTAWRILNPTVIGASKEELSSVSRESLCAFQLKFTNYHFNISKAHQHFKDGIRERLPKQNCQEYLATLNQVAESGLVDSIDSIRQYIVHYFKTTRNSEPRVGIHLTTANNKIVNITPSDGLPSTEKTPADYTAFSEVIEFGTPYLDNHIPRTISTNSSYRHAGIDVIKAKTQYKVKFSDVKLLSRWRIALSRIRKCQHDRSWAEYATQGNKNKLYKSHLAIPITFRSHNHLLPKNLQTLLNLHEDNRSILGYIFIDHQNTFYFDDSSPDDTKCSNVDVNFMYNYADMISLVLLAKLTYTDKSNSVNSFKKGYRSNRRRNEKRSSST